MGKDEAVEMVVQPGDSAAAIFSPQVCTPKWEAVIVSGVMFGVSRPLSLAVLLSSSSSRQQLMPWDKSPVNYVLFSLTQCRTFSIC